MKLKEKVNADMLAAMKAGDSVRVSTLRLLKAAVMKLEVSGTEKKDATDEEVAQLIKKELKQRKDSIEAFEKGGRPEMAENEKAEMKILEEYMPAQMGEQQVHEIVSQVIAATGAKSKAEFGKVIGLAMKQLKGQADGNVVSKVVGELLK